MARDSTGQSLDGESELISFDELYRAADGLAAPVPIAVAGGDDRTVIEAVAEARRRGWVAPILAGDEERIRATARNCEVDVSSWRVIDSHQPAVSAVAEIRAERARMLMKGQIATPDLIRAVLDADLGLRTERVLCQVVLMEVTSGTAPRRFLLADTGICIDPNLEQKACILRQVAATARTLGVAVPRLALMSATEKTNRAMPDTIDSEELVRRAAAGEFAPSTVAGPLSFDLAYASDAGTKKKIEGTVVGAADGMVFPNLLAANLTVKAIMYTADCRFGGMICGAECPIVFMSRADTTATRLNSLAFALRSFRSHN